MEGTETSLKYGRYEIVEQIGRECHGVVYRAHDPRSTGRWP